MLCADSHIAMDAQWAAVLSFDYSRWRFETVVHDDATVLEIGGKAPKFDAKILSLPSLDSKRVCMRVCMLSE